MKPRIKNDCPGVSVGFRRTNTFKGSKPISEENDEDSVILEEVLPDDYEPTEEEILEYAKWLGMDIETEKHLFWIAREGLKAPLPENWKPCKTADDEIYYFNFASDESVCDHPRDEHYRKVHLPLLPCSK